jgi:hypothetical protein
MLQAPAKRKPHLSQNPTGKRRGGSDLQIAESRKWTPLGRSIAQATAYSWMLSPHWACVVVCLEVSSVSRQTVAILRLCCTLNGKSWNYFLSMRQKKLPESLFTTACF